MLTDPANATGPTLAAAATTLCVVLAQAVHTVMKGRKSTTTLNSIETKLDEFTAEQRVLNEKFNTRITATEHLTRGVEGTNGLSGKSRDHEERLRALERTATVPPSEVGAYAPPGGRR